MAYAPLSSLIKSPNATAANTNATLFGKTAGTTPATVGVKPVSPMQNVTPPANTLPSSQAQAPKPVVTPAPKPTPAPVQTPAPAPTPAAPKPVAAPTPASVAPATPAVQPNTPAPQQQYTSPNEGLYAKLITDLANRSAQGSATSQGAQQGLMQTAAQNAATSGPAFDAYTNAVERQRKLQSDIAKSYGNIENTPIPLEFQQGREQVLARQYASQLDAAQQAVNQQQAAINQQIQGTQTQQAGYNQAGTLGQNAQTLTQQGLGTAAGYMQPVTQFGQLTNPITGEALNSTAMNQAVGDVVAKLKAGTMSYADATNALSGYGQGGINALQQALPSGFSISQSNALSGQQGTIKPAYEFASTALNNLKNLVAKLGFSQGTNIPIINSIGNAISTQTGFGSDATRQYTGALQEARNAYQQLLAASRGGTPSDYGAQAQSAIPDNATPNDIDAAIANLESLGGAKVDIYGNAGLGTTGTTSGGGGFAEAW